RRKADVRHVHRAHNRHIPSFLGNYANPSAVGSNTLIAGMSVTSSNTTSIGTKNRMTPLITNGTLTFVTLDSTNSTSPTGGVSKPSMRLKITTAAKCSG